MPWFYFPFEFLALVAENPASEGNFVRFKSFLDLGLLVSPSSLPLICNRGALGEVPYCLVMVHIFSDGAARPVVKCEAHEGIFALLGYHFSFMSYFLFFLCHFFFLFLCHVLGLA